MSYNELPPLPPDHPLTPYATYMMETTTRILEMMWLWLAMKVLLLAVVGYFIYRVWKLTKVVRESEMRAEDGRLLTAQLLSVIKGWVIAHDSEVKTEAAKLAIEADKQARRVETKIEQVPAKTAEAVAGRFTIYPDGHSPPGEAQKKTTPPPESAGGT